MSLNAISTSTSTALPTVNFHSHGHRKGAHLDTGGTTGSTGVTNSANGSSVGQLPVGVSTALFSNLLQSIGQAIGAQSGASATSPATAAVTSGAATSNAAGAANAATNVLTPGRTQEVRAFMHSLSQALKQDGLGSSAPAVASTAGGGTLATPASGQYQGNLVSSLQTLIQQVGSSGKPTAATETLNSTFQNLLSGSTIAASGSAATAPAPDQSSSAALQSFLNNLLQNLQGNGAQSLNALGSSVNANV